MPDESIFESSGSLFLPSCFSSSKEIVMTHSCLFIYLIAVSLPLSNQPLFGMEVGPSENVINLLGEISQKGLLQQICVHISLVWDLLGGKD